MFYSDLLSMTATSYAIATMVANSWHRPPIVFQTVEEFGDNN